MSHYVLLLLGICITTFTSAHLLAVADVEVTLTVSYIRYPKRVRRLYLDWPVDRELLRCLLPGRRYLSSVLCCSYLSTSTTPSIFFC